MTMKRTMVAVVMSAMAFAANAGARPRVVVADSPSSEGACPFFTNAAAKAGFDVSVRTAKAEEWEREEAYRDVDVVVFTGGFNDTKFPSGRTRLQLARFAAGGKGVLLSGFRCGPIRNWSRQIFPQVAGSYGSHPLTPWISPVGDSPLAKAFAGETLALAEFDCFGLRVGPDGTPFAKCGDETIAAFGEVGLGRVVVLGAFINTRGMPKRPDLIEAVYAEMLRYLSSGKQGDAAARSKAVAEAEEAFVRRDAIYKYTNDERGTINTQGLIPEMRDGALVPIESRQFLLEHYARTLDDKTLADECRKLAAKAKGVVASIHKAGDAFEARTRKAADGMSVVELAAALADKGIIDIGKCKSDFEAIAKRCPVEPMDALAAKCRAKAREERVARVAAENAEDIKSLSSLVSRLSSADSAVRLDAAMELGRIGAATPEVVSALVKALDDADSKVRVQATISLAWMQAKDAVPALLSKLADANCDERLRRRIAQALGQIGDVRAIPSLLPLLSSRDRWLRENAILSLGYLKAKEAVPMLVKYANGEDIPEHDGKYTRDEKLTVLDTRECAIRALGMIGDKSAVPALEKIAGDTKKWKNRSGSPGSASSTGISSFNAYGVERLASVAIDDIAAGGRAELGVGQPEALKSSDFFYALLKGNNALAGRINWTYTYVPWFKEEKNRRLLLPYLVDAGFTGIHDAWGATATFREEAYIDFVTEADELGLMLVLPAPSAVFATICDIMKGTQDYTFSRIGSNPLYIGCWNEENWPHTVAYGKDFESWLKRNHGADYAKKLGFKEGQSPLAINKWQATGNEYCREEFGGAMSVSGEGHKDSMKYDPGVNSGAIRAAALEMLGDDLRERFVEIQDWLHMRRKAFSFTYSVTGGLPAAVVGGQKAMSEADVAGPESYQAAGRVNEFIIERFRNGQARPVMTEYYNMYSPNLAHDLVGFYENAIHGKCFYPFDISHLTPFYGRYLTWGWDKGRWDLFRRVYSHVRDNKELYAVSPSAAKAAVVTSERSFACARKQCGWLASQMESIDQRGCAVYAALSMSHVCADVLDIDFADAKTLSKYGVLFLVDAKVLTEREQGVLRDWVAAGGTLVCDGATSLFSAKSLERLGDFEMADLFGVKYVRTDFMQNRPVFAFWPESWQKKSVMQITPSLDNPWLFQTYVWRDFKDQGAVVKAGDVEYDAVLGISRVELNGAKAVQTFADGSPALTVNEYGKGKAYLFASLAPMLGHVASNYESNPNKFDFWPGVLETYAKLARDGMSDAKNIQPVDVLNAPADVEMTVYEQNGGDRLVVHLLDRSETGRTLEGVSLRVNGDRPVKAVYRPGGKPLAFADRTASLGKFDVYDMVVVEFSEP